MVECILFVEDTVGVLVVDAVSVTVCVSILLIVTVGVALEVKVPLFVLDKAIVSVIVGLAV